MSKSAKKLVVKDIKELAPLSDVYELSKYSKYLVLLEKSILEGGYERVQQQANQVLKAFGSQNIPVIVLIVPNRNDVVIKDLSMEKI